MKRIMAFVSFLFLFVGFIYSGEVTWGFDWRTSNLGMVLGELSLPITEQFMYEDAWGKLTETTDYTLGKDVNPFMRRGSFVFGKDFFLYKKQVSLGFELNTGFVLRNLNIFQQDIYEPKSEDEQPWEDEHESDETKIIIPVNIVIITKYKFDIGKESKVWLRPYGGIGAGLNSSIFIKSIQIVDENDINIGEINYTYSGVIIAVVGADLFFFQKKIGVFIEFRYINPLGKGRNFRKQTTLGIGLRFI